MADRGGGGDEGEHDGKAPTNAPPAPHAPKPPHPPNPPAPKGPSEAPSNAAQKRIAELDVVLRKMLAAPGEP